MFVFLSLETYLLPSLVGVLKIVAAQYLISFMFQSFHCSLKQKTASSREGHFTTETRPYHITVFIICILKHFILCYSFLICQYQVARIIFITFQPFMNVFLVVSSKPGDSFISLTIYEISWFFRHRLLFIFHCWTKLIASFFQGSLFHNQFTLLLPCKQHSSFHLLSQVKDLRDD